VAIIRGKVVMRSTNSPVPTGLERTSNSPSGFGVRRMNIASSALTMAATRNPILEFRKTARIATIEIAMYINRKYSKNAKLPVLAEMMTMTMAWKAAKKASPITGMRTFRGRIGYFPFKPCMRSDGIYRLDGADKSLKASVPRFEKTRDTILEHLRGS